MYNKYIILLLFLLVSCKKGEKEYAAEPVIEFLSISPTSVTEGNNVIISFKYTDGDGDLGENRSDVKNLFVTDSRNNLTYSFRIKQLAPSGVSIPITGTLNTDIGVLYISNAAASETVNFSLYIVDRAGHQSNVITTPPVTINR